MAPDGCTEAAMKANSFGIGLLATVVAPGVVQAAVGRWAWCGS
jgi:hypothetical protein